MSKEKVFIRVDLDGPLAEKFNILKQKKGIKNSTELIRILITQEYERIMGSQQIS